MTKMNKNFDKEACPVCGSEEFSIDDFRDDNLNFEEVSKWWLCRCDKCGCMFDIERVYELVDVSVSRAHGN